METSARHDPLEDVIDLLPNELQDRKVRQRLRKLSGRLDQLVAERAGEVIIDREALHRLTRDGEIFPPEVQDRVWREVEGHLGKKIKDRAEARHLGWREFAGRDNPFEPVPTSELRRLGIDASTSVDDAKEILRKHLPDFPDALLDADAAELRETALRALEHNRTVWDCVVAKLGFWAALGIFAAVGAFLIVGTATGPWGLPLAIWLIAVLGFGSGTIVGNCVLNPDR